MQNWFDTLNAALESENLLYTWKVDYPAIQYNSNFSYTFDNGTKYGHYVSIYRNEQGKYERPIHYNR